MMQLTRDEGKDREPKRTDENELRNVRNEEKSQNQFVGEQHKKTGQVHIPVPVGGHVGQIENGIKPCSFYVEREKKLVDEIKEELKSNTLVGLSFSEFLRKVVEARKSKGWEQATPCIPSYVPSNGFLYSYWNLNFRNRNERGFRGSFNRFSKYLNNAFTKRTKVEEN